jgi:hypothetical protein
MVMMIEGASACGVLYRKYPISLLNDDFSYLQTSFNFV